MSAYHTTIEELGKGQQLAADIQIIYDYHPGEPMVRYYPDGSGYPGSPAYVEIYDVYLEAVYDCDGNKLTRKELGDKLPWASEVIRNIVFADVERFEEEAADDHYEREDW